MAGWHVSTTSSHGSTPDFHVENGMLVGAQRPPGKGGVLLSDLEVWLNDRKITDWTDTANHAPGGATSGKIG
jgi:hypothetical protein